ncbi:MAG TPA: LysM peptidoglycan-binding domain-containing protein [Chitinophagaceae bacterium]|jgi:hypothetical protein
MKRSVFVFLFSVLITTFSSAQTGHLLVQGVSPKLWLVHSVAPKENWYSIGRLYNVSPKELAPYNGLPLDKPLAIGQILKVPLNAGNFSQDGSKAADEVFVPIYHTVQEKEWMYRLSVNYNKLSKENVEKWNGIKAAQIKPGLSLVIGYLKVKTGQSALASKGTSHIVAAPAQPVMADAEPKTESSKTGIVQEKKQEPVATEKPVVEKTTPPVVKNDLPKEQPKPVVVAPPTITVTASPDNKGGYFKSLYGESGKSATGNAGMFKSTSGWHDGKYYALMNNVSVGSIIKVDNPVNGRAIYAKVLGSLPDMKESAGLTVRISDAAAAELEVNTAKFGVDIKY